VTTNRSSRSTFPKPRGASSDMARRPPDFYKPKTPDNILPILGAIADSGAILIGGQAINIWSIQLELAGQEPWKSSRPYSSTDADGLGDVVALQKLAESLRHKSYGIEVLPAESSEHTHKNTGVILATSAKLNIGINILHKPRGLIPQEIIRTAVELNFRGKVIKLLHPLLCVESKATCLIELQQDDPAAPRQDEKHLKLAVANLRVFLSLLGDKEPSRACALADRIRGLAVHQLGVTILKKHQLDVLDAVPWKAWGKSSAPVLKKFAESYDEVVGERATSIKQEQEAKAWLRTLKNETSLDDIQQGMKGASKIVKKSSTGRGRPLGGQRPK